MMGKRRQIEAINGEAAGTTTLSKSWYSAWLTRPNLDLDKINFNGYRGDSKFDKFSEFVNKTIQSFQQVGPYESVVLSPELFEAGNFIGISVDWCKIDTWVGSKDKERPKFKECNQAFRTLTIVFKTIHGPLRAIAGLALAIVFTWRLLRARRGPQRRQFKRQALSGSSSSVSNRASVNNASSEVSNHLEESGTQNVIDEFFQPIKKQAMVRSSVPEVHLEIAKVIDLYLMERVLDDESEKKILMALEDARVFTSAGLVKDKEQADGKPPSLALMYMETRKRTPGKNYKTSEVNIVQQEGHSKSSVIIPDEFLQPYRDEIVKDTIAGVLKMFKHLPSDVLAPITSSFENRLGVPEFATNLINGQSSR
ncbi:peroxisome biogenesis protein 22 [Phtheirospermum japonicum]|uniref:Peroxisome biogenesis protein 22 n=1 Tax=Phtheirospermum japonicum TaxID=374723 RepID=A0A830BFW8_9LAMI|nr:peroxisome biogenesis protein 22 [Phtheirospermum japonicum]